jgi:hypothetical protein
MELSRATIERLNEIALTMILDNIFQKMNNEKIDYFLEHFCRAYAIDFTTISIIKNMYYKRIKPNKREIALFSLYTDRPFTKLPIDYRTFKKYKDEWEINGQPELRPMLVNQYFPPVIKAFVNAFISLMYDDLVYIKEVSKYAVEVKT